MRYNEFPYKRVSVESKKEEMSEWLERFKTSESADEQITVLKEVDGASREYESYASIASLNFNKNIHDEDAKAEKEYYDSISPDMQEIYNKLDIAVDASEFKTELREEWGDTFLKKIEMDLKTFDPKTMDMLRTEMAYRNE